MSDRVYVRPHFSDRSKERKTHEKRADIDYYMKKIHNSFESLEVKEIAIDELKRLGARRELTEIASDPWTHDSIKKRAKDALRSM